MVKRDGNIDIVFRDGLRDMEVLPPADVWDNIYSEISAPRSNSLFFRAAAGIAAVVSLGLLAYFVGVRPTDSSFNSLDAGLVQDPENFALLPQESLAQPVLAELSQQNLSSETQDYQAVPASTVVRKYEEESDLSLVNTSPELSGNSVFDSRKLNIMQSGDGSIADQTSENEDLSNILQQVDYNMIAEPERSKWMLGAKISPTYLSTNLRADNSALAGERGDESAILSYTGGLSVIYSVGSRLSVQTGIYYSSLGRQVSDINSYSGYASFSEAKGEKIFGIATSTGTIASTNNDFFLVDISGDRISSIASARNFDPEKAGLNPFGSTLRQSFEYIEVPFMLSYKLIDKKMDFNIMGGMSYSLLLDNQVYAVSEGSVVPIGSMEDLAGLLLSSSLGMSMQYSLNENFSLNLEPSIRYYLNSDGSLSASNNPFTFGIFSGVFYKF